jgi:uncharacterized membrane protein (DUF2068 family)
MKSKNAVLRLIALFKFAKAASLVMVGIASLKAANEGVLNELELWIAKLGFDPGNHLVERALGKASTLPPNRVRELGVVSFIYATLFLIEGIGLWLGKRWAEWFTVIITSSLVPLEGYELYRHSSVLKVLTLLVNLAVVWYLVHRIRHEDVNEEASSDRPVRTEEL